jgi:hypothetical protein
MEYRLQPNPIPNRSSCTADLEPSILVSMINSFGISTAFGPASVHYRLIGSLKRAYGYGVVAREECTSVA